MYTNETDVYNLISSRLACSSRAFEGRDFFHEELSACFSFKDVQSLCDKGCVV